MKTFSAKVSFIIILAVLVSYGSSFRNGFVYDDHRLIEESPYVKDWKYLPKLIMSDMWSLTNSPEKPVYYRPLPMVTFLFDYKIWGLRPAGYHVENTILHAVNSILVFNAVTLMTGNGYFAAATALIFAVHPAQTESVTFISSRGELLFLLFLLLTIILFIRGKTAFSLIAFSLSLLSKETSLITPVLLFLTAYFSSGAGRERLKFKNFAPYIAVIIIYLALRIFILPPVQLAGTLTESFGRIFYVMTRGAAVYIKLMLWPAGLSISHLLDYHSLLFDPASLFSILLVILLFAIAFKSVKKNKYISFSILWFFTALLPASHALGPMPFLIAERQLYLPSIGFSLIAAWLLLRLSEIKPKTAAAVFLALISIYSVRTINRNSDWGDEAVLWEKVLKLYPGSGKAHNNLGLVYSKRKYYTQALEHFQKALNVKYHPKLVLFNLAETFEKIDRLGLALDAYHEILKIDPLERFVHGKIGAIYLKENKTAIAFKEYSAEISLNPKYAEPYNGIGIIHAMKNNFSEAQKYFETAARLDPSNEGYKKNLLLLKPELIK